MITTLPTEHPRFWTPIVFGFAVFAVVAPIAAVVLLWLGYPP
jgi:hypothetical protein